MVQIWFKISVPQSNEEIGNLLCNQVIITANQNLFQLISIVIFFVSSIFAETKKDYNRDLNKILISKPQTIILNQYCQAQLQLQLRLRRVEIV